MLKKSILIFILLLGINTLSVEAKTPIMGKSDVTSYQLGKFLLMHNAYPKLMGIHAFDLGKYYIEIGEIEGVRGDIAFAQAMKETGYLKFGGDVVPEQNNYAGIGTTGGGVKGHYFSTPYQGVTGHIQHLKAYGSTDALVLSNVDPRFHLVTRGIAPNFEDLNGRWAVPGVGYGESIVNMYEEIKKIEDPHKRYNKRDFYKWRTCSENSPRIQQIRCGK